GRETLTYREAADGTWCGRSATAYDADGNAVTETRYLADASGDRVANATVAHAFDPMGRETASDDSKVAGSAITYYDARGNALQSWTEGPDTTSPTASTRTLYDLYGRVTTETAPGAVASQTVNVYDPDGLVKKTTNPDGTYTVYTYDEAGNVIVESVPIDEEETADTRRFYDIGSRMTAEVSSEDATTTFAFDLAGRQTATAADATTPTVTAYNSLGWKLSETDSDGVVKSWTYDRCGRTVVETLAGKDTVHAYDALGHEVSSKEANGTSVRYVFDRLGRALVETQEDSSGVVLKRTSRTYDALSRSIDTTVSDLEHGTTRTSSATYPSGTELVTHADIAYKDTTLTVSYDGSGRESSRVALTAAGQHTLALGEFDGADRPKLVTLDNHNRHLTYDESGRVKQETGYGYQSGSIGAQLGYDRATGRLANESYLFRFLGSTASVRTHQYTAEGRLAAEAITGFPSTTYAYQAGSGNLIGMRRGTDATTTLVYAEGNRLAALRSGATTTTVFGFDSRGRRDSQGTLANPRAVTYGYDDSDRLSAYGDAVRGISATFTYDSHGQRTRSTVTSGSITTTTTYTYDGLTLLALSSERSNGTTWGVTYVPDGAGRPWLGVYSGTETTVPVSFGVRTTERGDVTELIDANVVVFAYMTYDAYGNPGSVATTGTATIPAAVAATIANANPLRYAGYCYDSFSGLYYCSQRYYDPATAQFITKDPAKADGEESAYQYCGGDPVGKTDPSGLRSEASGGGGYADITTKFFKLMRKHYREASAAYFALGRNWYAKSAWWVSRVYRRARWDLKRKKPWKKSRFWKFNGSTVAPEDLGNIHYGYVGKGLRYLDAELLNAGGATHISKKKAMKILSQSYSAWEFVRKLGVYEPAGGKKMIQKGINLYYRDKYKGQI
ncbi:MAG: polymorphic toxin type 44 domain-containing protein, partial [Actinomycetia bacterium]|nr:polymorphic toxin type 44 domain-containing protein [Actinomycetes bacterium]